MGQQENLFLDTLKTPNISGLIIADLGATISKEEISIAVDDLKTGKALGPYGLPTEVYKHLWLNCCPLFLTCSQTHFGRESFLLR